MPQPIDMQSELARTTMVERIQELAGRLAQQQRTQGDVDEVRVDKETQTQESTEAQSEHVDEDGKRKNAFVRKRKKHAKQGQDDPAAHTVYTADEKKSSISDDEHHELDVTI